jgi:hypothetical protein
MPLYSYTANPDSILHTVDYTKSALNLIIATSVAFKDMKKYKVSKINQRIWKSRFMWDVLSRVYSYSKRIDDKRILKKVLTALIRLQKDGVFDNPPDFHALRYKHRILKFISLNS